VITGLVITGVSYTIYSEYMDVVVQRSWTYAAMTERVNDFDTAGFGV